jgi:translation initiation factor IF-2
VGPVPGQTRCRPGRPARCGRDRLRRAPGGGRPGHRGARPDRAAGRRQDGHDPGPRRRLVRGLHSVAGHGRVGRLPPGPCADGAAAGREPGLGRDLAGGDLVRVHARRSGQRAARAVPPARHQPDRAGPRPEGGVPAEPVHAGVPGRLGRLPEGVGADPDLPGARPAGGRRGAGAGRGAGGDGGRMAGGGRTVAGAAAAGGRRGGAGDGPGPVAGRRGGPAGGGAGRADRGGRRPGGRRARDDAGPRGPRPAGGDRPPPARPGRPDARGAGRLRHRRGRRRRRAGPAPGAQAPSGSRVRLWVNPQGCPPPATTTTRATPTPTSIAER